MPEKTNGMIRVGKLVRDGIPGIARARGERARFRRVETQQEYVDLLERKLAEELDEVRRARREGQQRVAEEVGDLLDVAFEYALALGVSARRVNRCREEKDRALGGFRTRWVLEEMGEEVQRKLGKG